jgi:hypothetical protein
MDLQPGLWLECKQTQETGRIKYYNGKTICLVLGEGITLYTTVEGLKNLGWSPVVSDHTDDS